MFLCKKGKLNLGSGKTNLCYKKLVISISTKADKRQESPTTLKKRHICWKCSLMQTVTHLSLCFDFKGEKQACFLSALKRLAHPSLQNSPMQVNTFSLEQDKFIYALCEEVTVGRTFPSHE